MRPKPNQIRTAAANSMRRLNSTPVEQYPEDQRGEAWEDPSARAKDSSSPPQDSQGDLEPWDRPIPLGDVPPVSPFPEHVLPVCLATFVREAASALACPTDYVGVPLLAIAGAAIGASRALQIKPGWQERPCLYAAVVAPPGSAKSPALNADFREA
jgi:hypothetical protein